MCKVCVAHATGAAPEDCYQVYDVGVGAAPVAVHDCWVLTIKQPIDFACKCWCWCGDGMFLPGLFCPFEHVQQVSTLFHAL